MSENVLQTENLVADFIDVTRQVLSQISALEVTVKEIKEVNGTLGTECMDITGILGFSGGRQGSIIMTFSEKLALRIVGGMLGIEFEEFDTDVRDGIGELVNIVAGGAKTRLQNRGINFELSIPNTILGRDHKITAATITNRTRIEFESPVGSFFIEVCLKDD